ncbi:hypothetical protein TrRE_jg9779, partial [Triparma retinervis]
MRLIRRAVILKSLTKDKRKYIKVNTITYPPGLSRAQELGAVMKLVVFRSCTSPPTVASLTSNVTQGVDNTGQTRIWECAALALRHLLRRYKVGDLGDLLELGCGMVGFSGLWFGGTITDGHDSGVFNNLVNLDLNRRGGGGGGG